jgi:hypothetical protein
MEDLMLSARIDENTTLRVSPIAPQTYLECIDEDTLGGDRGYFVLLSRKNTNQKSPEILAKAPNFDAAEALFDLIVGNSKALAAA